MINRFLGLFRTNGQSHRVYSIGYQGRSIDEFIDILEKNKIKVLIDTRKSGFSRKPYFSRHVLKKMVEKRGIEFVSLPDVGAPKEFREYLKETENLSVFFKMYKKHIVQNNLFNKLTDHINGERTCLMCFEKNPYECHRLILSEMLTDNINVNVTHL